MAITMGRKHFYEFAPFRVDPEERTLWCNGQIVSLPPKAFDVLLALIQRSGRLVSKEELMKAVWPDTFVEEANLSQNIFLLRKALGEKANEARYIVTVPGRGYRFAAEVHELADDDRVGKFPITSKVPAGLSAAQTKPRHYLVWGILAALFSLTVATAYIAHLRQRRQPVAIIATSPTPRVRRSVAVLGFHNRSPRPEDAWLSTALSEMLSTELAAGEHLRILPTEEISRVKLELHLAEVDSLSPSTLAKLKANLGADVVVVGSYTVVQDQSTARIRLDLRLQDAGAGEIVTELAATGTEADLFGLISQCGTELRGKLGVEGRSPAEALNVHASLPSNPEAARLYAEGLARLRVFDALLARDLLREAVAADATYPMSHAALASAWSALGYDDKASAEAQAAFKLSTHLSREERLLVEGNYHETTKDSRGAVENYRMLFAVFPDNLDYGLRLVHAQTVADNVRAAETTLDTLRKLPAPASEDARIDLAEVNICWVLNDYKRGLAAASRAAAKGEAQGAQLIVAQARRQQGAALRVLGENAKALASYAEAKDIFAAAGDRANAAGILRDVADITAEQGDYSLALKLYRESLSVARELGHRSGVAADLNNMAVVFENQRDFATAQKTYERARALYREVGDERQATIVLGNVGEVLFYQGRLTQAESRYRQAISYFHPIGASDSEAWQLSDLAVLLLARGDLSDAESMFEKALSLWGDSNPHASTQALLGLGEIQLARGNVAAARHTQERALDLRQKLGEKQSIAESRLALARISLEEGRAAEAESAARQTVTEFHAESVPDLEAAAYALLARSLLEQGKSEQAQKAAKSAVTNSARSQEPMTQISVAITAARVRAASYPHSSSGVERAAQMIHDLQALANKAKKYTFLGLEFEARLAEAQVKLDSGRTNDSVAQLTSLAEEAQAKGFGLIARKALALRN
jgi:DNA-binding winged helix-turn-helix (wHTH) protein/tetratricopeptide (TPR) repeat protein